MKPRTIQKHNKDSLKILGAILDYDCDTYKKISDHTGLSQSYTFWIMKENSWKLKYNHKERAEIDNLINEGRRQIEIVNISGHTKQDIFDYISRTGKRELHKQRLKERKYYISNIINTLQYHQKNLLYTIDSILLEKVCDSDEATQFGFLDHISTHKRYNNLNLEDRINIFKACSEGLGSVKAEKIYKVSRKTFTNKWKQYGLKSKYKSPKEWVIPEDIGKKLIKNYCLEMYAKDAGKEFDLSGHSVSKFWKSKDLKPHNRRYGQPKLMTVKEIFELKDKGNSGVGISKQKNVSDNTIYRYLKNRPYWEERIKEFEELRAKYLA